MSGEFRCFVANSILIGEYGMMLGGGASASYHTHFQASCFPA